MRGHHVASQVAIAVLLGLATAGCGTAGGGHPPAAANTLTWSRAIPVPRAPGPVTISCVSASFCAAGWFEQGISAPNPPGYLSTFDGATWGPVLGGTRGAADTLACSSRSLCIAVTALGQLLDYDGTGWRPLPETDVSDIVYTVACAPSSFCIGAGVVDQQGTRFGVSLTYDDGSWVQPSVIGRNFSPNAISCASASFCVAVGASYLPTGAESDGEVPVPAEASAWNGTSWTTPMVIDRQGQAVAVSCVAPTFCAVMTGTSYSQGDAVTYDGTWSKPVKIASAVVAGVSCASRSWCLAVNGNVPEVLVYDGSTWSSDDKLIPAAAKDTLVTAICPTITTCYATDLNGNVYVGHQ